MAVAYCFGTKQELALSPLSEDLVSLVALDSRHVVVAQRCSFSLSLEE